MKLKVKIADILRKWAERLDPIFPYNQTLNPELVSKKCDIQRVMVKHTIPLYAYQQFSDRFNQLAHEDITLSIAKALDSRHLIALTIHPGTEQVDYIGEVQVVVNT